MTEPPEEPIKEELSLPLLIASDVRANPRNEISQPLEGVPISVEK